MLVLSGGQAESLFDLGLPVEVAELPADLAALDVLLADRALLAPIEAGWAAGHRDHGRPSIPMDRFVRLMIVKARSGGWGYETLVREVSDSLHLRRFCRIALTDRVPDESTVRKLVKRLGPDVIDEITMAVIARATSRDVERRFVARAARIDSTVVESDIRYPTDLGLAQDAARMLAAEAKKVADLAGAGAPRVTDRSKSGTGSRRAGQAASCRSDRAGRRARREGLRADHQARRGREDHRLVSMSDPDARPIRKGKLRQPTEFGTVMQVAELCENTRRGARGLIVPLATKIGSPNEHELLKQTGPVAENLPPPDRLFIAGRHAAGSKKTNRRMAKFRVGCEGRISHLKRRYGLRRSRLKGYRGTRTWAAWAVLTYNLDTLAIRTA